MSSTNWLVSVINTDVWLSVESSVYIHVLFFPAAYQCTCQKCLNKTGSLTAGCIVSVCVCGLDLLCLYWIDCASIIDTRTLSPTRPPATLPALSPFLHLPFALPEAFTMSMQHM